MSDEYSTSGIGPPSTVHPSIDGYTSRLSGFHRLSVAERRERLASLAGLSPADMHVLAGGGLESLQHADSALESVVGTLALPLGIATNLIVNGTDVLLPVVIEEPSVVAALSYGALLTRGTGGVLASCDAQEMIGQIQIYALDDPESARLRLLEAAGELLAQVNEDFPLMVARGGGARALEVRLLTTSEGVMLVVHLVMDVRDAMGANVVNRACEALAPAVAALTGGQVGVRVLSNLADHRIARATCRVAAASLARAGISGEQAVRGILAAQALADIDPYRAATHNKGILNGIDGVAVATGNDWRAIEAGAHAYAARDGQYGPLTAWRRDPAGDLIGSIELPLAVGTQGAAVRAHPTAAVALKIMRVTCARRLSEVMAAAGLVQNLAALRALATEGIQEGHMRLHARQIALAVGAQGAEVDALASRMVAEGAFGSVRARELLLQMYGR